MRTFVTTAALTVCAACCVVPLTTAGATPSETSSETSSSSVADDLATTTPIKHVVVVFQENASFDHYFGTYPIAANPSGDPPFVARPWTPDVDNLLPTPLNGNRDLRTTNPNQSPPFRLDRTQFVTCSQDHGYRPEQRAANGGLMNRFVQATSLERRTCLDRLPRPVTSPQVMGYFDGNTVTALWNYAQHYALNDYSFATNYGPSTPGALNLVAGRTSGASPDSGSVAAGVLYDDADPAFDICSHPGTKDVAELGGPNIGDLLTGAGIPWGWFQGGFRLDPDTEPTVACAATTKNLAGIEETDYEPHHNPFQYFASTANRDHLPPSSAAAIGHDDEAKHLYDLDDFWVAADAGDLPAVSFLKATGFQDGHPGPQNSNPLDEQDFLVETINHLQRLPEWSSTAVVLAWDDSDGDYDHEFPPNVHHSGNLTLDGLYGTTPTTLCLAAANKPAPKPETIFPMRCGYGERVPLLVISPYARENTVDHTLTDQTSILRFIEDNWGLGLLGHDSFDAGAGTLLNMFDFGQRRDDLLMLNHFTGNPDQPPSVDPPVMTPTSPRTGDVLTVSATASDPDHDPTNPGRQDGVKLSYEWFNGTTRLPETGSGLDLSVAGNGDRGDTITVRVTADDGLDVTTSSASALVVDTAPTANVSPNASGVEYSDEITPIEITASDADGDGLTVDAVGLPEGLDISRAADGRWEVSGADRGPSGTYDATIRVSDGTETTERPVEIQVAPERARVGYTGALIFSTESVGTTSAPVTLRARVTQEEDGSPGDISRARVLFDLYAPGNSTGRPDATYPASPDAGGDVNLDLGTLGTGTWTVVVRTDPSGGYFAAPDSDAVPVTVHAPTLSGFVTGGGWVHDPGYLGLPVPVARDDHGDFGLEARLTKDRRPSGSVTYSFTGADSHRYVVRSTGWQGGGLVVDGSHATVAGDCAVTVLDADGAVLSEMHGARYRLDVTDGGRSDAFALSVFTSDGTLYHRVGTPQSPLGLGGGQVVIHR